MRLAFVVLALCGCDQVLGLEREEPDCGTYATVIDDTFDGMIPCEPWGARFENSGSPSNRIAASLE